MPLRHCSCSYWGFWLLMPLWTLTLHTWVKGMNPSSFFYPFWSTWGAFRGCALLTMNGLTFIVSLKVLHVSINNGVKDTVSTSEETSTRLMTQCLPWWSSPYGMRGNLRSPWMCWLIASPCHNSHTKWRRRTRHNYFFNVKRKSKMIALIEHIAGMGTWLQCIPKTTKYILI